MMREPILRQALRSGALASLASTLALAVAARAEGKGALRPLNATSHWLNGEAAAAAERADLDHTAVGYATHHAATVFWALIYQAWAGRRPRSPRALFGGAVVLSGVAAAVDYRATPARFTPGWEFVLSRRGMALAYGAMAIGLAAGAATAGRRMASGRRRRGRLA